MSKLRVTQIQEFSEAEGVGIRIGDEIESYDGRSVETNEEFEAAVSKAAAAGKKSVPIVLSRSGATVSVEVMVGPLGINTLVDYSENSVSLGYKSAYQVSKTIIALAAFFGWTSVVIGSVIVLGTLAQFMFTPSPSQDYSYSSNPFQNNPLAGLRGELTLLATLPGFILIGAGFLIVMLTQLLKAGVDTADQTREIMKLLQQRK